MVVRNAILGRRRVITAFRPWVLAWLNTEAPPTPASSAPSSTARCVSRTFVETLTVLISPSSMATTSVKVPPTSTPIIMMFSLASALLR